MELNGEYHMYVCTPSMLQKKLIKTYYIPKGQYMLLQITLHLKNVPFIYRID